jgi:hypothetical protein
MRFKAELASFLVENPECVVAPEGLFDMLESQMSCWPWGGSSLSRSQMEHVVFDHSVNGISIERITALATHAFRLMEAKFVVCGFSAASGPILGSIDVVLPHWDRLSTMDAHNWYLFGLANHPLEQEKENAIRCVWEIKMADSAIFIPKEFIKPDEWGLYKRQLSSTTPSTTKSKR